MHRYLLQTAIALGALLMAAPSFACEFQIKSEKNYHSIPLADVPAGIVSGAVECDGDRYPVQFWTLEVDARQSELGIRDNALFDTRHTGPLTSLMSARIERNVRVNVLERTETVELSRSFKPRQRAGYRRFVTFCDNRDNTDPLNCSVGAARIKARVTSKHVDDDGYLDASMHEISYFDGISRLHVMSFMTEYSDNPAHDVAHWIRTIGAISDVLKL